MTKASSRVECFFVVLQTWRASIFSTSSRRVIRSFLPLMMTMNAHSGYRPSTAPLANLISLFWPPCNRTNWATRSCHACKEVCRSFCTLAIYSFWCDKAMAYLIIRTMCWCVFRCWSCQQARIWWICSGGTIQVRSCRLLSNSSSSHSWLQAKRRFHLSGKLKQTAKKILFIVCKFL